MRRSFVAMAAWVALLLTPLLWAQYGPAAASGQSHALVRELRGEVMTRSAAPVANAIVYLKNTKTLTVKTFITGQDGAYRFPGLAPNVDYEVFAEHRGKRSDVKTLSSFDSRPQASINLKINSP